MDETDQIQRRTDQGTLKQGEAGMKMMELCRHHGIGEDTFTTGKRRTKVWGQRRAEAEAVGDEEGQAEVGGGGYDAGQGHVERTALKELLDLRTSGQRRKQQFRLLQFDCAGSKRRAVRKSQTGSSVCTVT